MHYLSICGIHKSEGPALREWIEYHRIVGCDHFYLYNNDDVASNPSISNGILAPYVAQGLVNNISFPGTVRQLPAYNDCIQRFADESRWIAFIDLDEFMYPVMSDKISDLLRQYEAYGGLAMNWFCYGSSGYAERQPLVIDAYRHRAVDTFSSNQHVKTILNPKLASHWSGQPHLPIMRPPYFVVNELGVRIDSPFSPITGSKIRLNHYVVKSKEDYAVKFSKGRADTVEPRSKEIFRQYDNNEVYDSGIADRFSEVVKTRLKAVIDA